MTPASAPLRILVVEFLPSGGMFQFGFQFADAVAAEGHVVELLTGPDPELLSRRGGYRVIPSLPTWHPNAILGGSGLRQKARRARRALQLAEAWRRVLVHSRRTRPDIVQFGELRYSLDSAWFLLVARFGRAGAVVDVAHNPLPYDVHGKGAAVEKTGRVTRGLLARAYEAADLVLVLGEKPREELLEAFPGVRRAAVCGHGDYSGVLDASGVRRPSEAGPSILFFGAWTKYKNIPLLLEAFALVRQTVPEARLTVAGPPMPDVDVAALTAAASAVGNVDMRPGYVAMEEVPELFDAHRVVAFTYDTVNVSGSVHMAYTFGRPVVASDVGAMGDVVHDGVTGLLAAPSAAAVGAALVSLLVDDEAADRMGSEATVLARGESSWEATAGRAVSAYREALGATPVAAAEGIQAR